jgi:hypothetical protein
MKRMLLTPLKRTLSSTFKGVFLTSLKRMLLTTIKGVPLTAVKRVLYNLWMFHRWVDLRG